MMQFVRVLDSKNLVFEKDLSKFVMDYMDIVS